MMNKQKLLHDSFQLKRRLPENISLADGWLFANELYREYAGISIYHGSNILVNMLSGAAYSGLSIISESVDNPARIKHYAQSTVACSWLRLIKHRGSYTKQPVMLVHDCHSRTYGHWMTDVISRIYLARDASHGRSIILPQSYKGIRFMLESLAVFGFCDSDIVYAQKPVMLCSDLVVPSYAGPILLNPKDEIAQEIRDHFYKYFSISITQPRLRIYATRVGAHYRHILNESHVIELLEAMGFLIVRPESLSIRVQVELFSQAEIFVGITGSALNNMMFMQPESSVIEFRMKDDNSNLHYFSYASAHQLKYYYLSCFTDQDDVLKSNFTIDVNALKDLINLAFSR
jgi:capsular polysaccharide biosynthesis protein